MSGAIWHAHGVRGAAGAHARGLCREHEAVSMHAKLCRANLRSTTAAADSAGVSAVPKKAGAQCLVPPAPGIARCLVPGWHRASANTMGYCLQGRNL